MEATNGLVLWERLRSGDNKAFREMYDKYRLYLLAISVNIVKCPDLANDVLHDVFMTAFEKSTENYCITTSLRAWLVRLTINRSIDFLKRIKKNKNSDKIEILSRQTVNNTAEASLKLQEIERFKVECLTGTEQKIFDLQIKGFSLKEIALSNNSQISTIKVHLRNIRKSLKNFRNKIL